MGEGQTTQQHAYHHSCLGSDSTILLPYKYSAHDRPHNKSNDQSCSPLTTMFGKLRDRYQSYCTTYKIYTITTCHRGAGHACKDRDLNSHVEDARNIDMSPNHDNESTNSSDTTIVFGGSEADGHLSNFLPNSQSDLNILAREINSIQQEVEAREGQPVEGLNCIDCLEGELQNLSLTLRTLLTSNPSPTEPFGEVVCQYTDTLCTTQKQTNLTNSLLHDITIFNKHHSMKLEEWLMDIETAADLTIESLTKLAKAKSRGLPCMSVTEAVNSERYMG